jgi:EAL domain-containing protein (putative c-di-GMP-specific phosphodiesterase class I)/FixJ family two-component response regulator
MNVSELRFVVAEDHDFQRRTLVGLLKRLGAAHVGEAADGAAALELFRTPDANIDVIISDLDMPGMDGMELIRHVGESGLAVSVILSSAIDRAVLASVEAMTRAYGITLLGAIEKPVTQVKLEALIERHRPPQPKASAPRASAPSFSLDDIRQGLANDEFEPFYQPKIDLHTGELAGAEALARWRHPERGIVSPYFFIAAMEEGGLIDDLTWTMMAKSACQVRLWAQASPPLTPVISVNLSAKSLGDPQVADHITQIVRDEGVDPGSFVLEVTESAAVAQVAQTLETLARLRIRGFRLSIDDYGTGYSSMQQLARIAFTELKIDQSFVMSALDVEASRVILESSLDMARRLNVHSVAEGVETRAHWDLLLSLGCDIAQGYFIARPLDAAGFAKWAAEWTPPA